jgi:acyl-coenzyme A thioesterase PaaI-like protein
LVHLDRLNAVHLLEMTDPAERQERAASTHDVDDAVVERVRASFARQGAMVTLGADLAVVASGRVAIELPIEPRLSQQNGFLHAGVVVAALDSACGYAALTLMPADAEVAERRVQGQPTGPG